MSFQIAVILISTDEHAEFIEPCLQSIEDTKRELDLRIVLVDNDGFGASSNVIANLYKSIPIEIINQKQKKGFAANFNDAMKIITEPYVLLLNVDTVMTPETINACVELLDKNKDLGAVTVRLRGFDNKLQSSAKCFPLPHILLWEQIGVSRLFPKSKIFGKNRNYYSAMDKMTIVDWISGAFILCKRQAIIDINGMDEDYFLYSEDTDFGMRLYKKGWKVALNPHNFIFHHKDPIGKKRRKKNFILTHRNILLFLQKHYSKGTFLRGRIVLFFGMIIRVLSIPLLAKKGLAFVDESLKAYLVIMRMVLTGNLSYNYFRDI